MAKTVSPVDVLLSVARDNNRPHEAALTDFLDYAIDAFSTEKYLTHSSMQDILTEACDKSRPYFTVLLSWLTDVSKSMDNGKWCDFFGQMYEQMFQSRVKASRTGQFFTPDSISDLMASVTATRQADSSVRVNDCCCGSGRLLLAHYMQHSSPQHCGQAVAYYVAQDIDLVSCKMCALNMMAHGMVGEVHCQDTLLMSPPITSFYVNEVRTPFQTPFYSIRKVS